MKRSLSILFVSFVLVALAAGCGGSSGPKSVPADSVAVVGSDTITKAMLDKLLGEVQASDLAHHQPFPKKGTSGYTSLRDQLVQYLVRIDELEQKAKGMGVEVTDADVAARLKQFKQQSFGGDEKKYQQALKANGLTDAGYRDALRAQVLSQRLQDKVAKDVKVSDADVRVYYDAHGKFARRTVRHILVSTQALANRLYAQIQQGADFATLAKRYSNDPGSKALGGKLTVARGQTYPEFDAVAFSLKTGQVSKPVHTQAGWHVIKAVGPIQPTPFAQVKESIRQQLQQQQKNDAWSKFLNEVQKDFCSGKIAYQVGFAPSPDPCVSLLSATTSATTSSLTP